MSISYPVADTAEQALHAPRGTATREREAGLLAGAPVRFERRLVGPAYRSRDAALDAYAGRVDDDRPGRGLVVSGEARWCELKAVSPEGVRAPPPVRPTLQGGQRWPASAASPPGEVVWRLSVAYWRIVGADLAPELPAARALRRDPTQTRALGAVLDARALRRLSAQPLRAMKPQQPLDLGLFEVRRPESPNLLMPDE